MAYSIQPGSQIFTSKYFYIRNTSPGNGGTYSDTNADIPAFPIFLSLFNYTIEAGGFKFIASDDFLRRLDDIQSSNAQIRLVKTDGTPEATGINELAYWLHKSCLNLYQAVLPSAYGVSQNADGTYTLPWFNNVKVFSNFGYIPGPSEIAIATAVDSAFSSLLSSEFNPPSTDPYPFVFDKKYACYASFEIES